MMLIVFVGTGVSLYKHRFPDISKDHIDFKRSSKPRKIHTHKNMVLVQISGAVYFPGVYTLLEGTRTHELIQKAGGNRTHAQKEGLNLAKVLKDGQHVIIPSQQTHPITAKVPVISKVDINSATQVQLKSLPGIGPKLASQILLARKKSHGFKSIQDLLKVKGIGPSKLKKIKPYVLAL